MSYSIIEASPKAQTLCEPGYHAQDRTRDANEGKYPFKALLIAESFTVPFEGMAPGALASLRSSASAYSKRLGRKFKVFVHNEYRCIEVARIA